LWPDAAIQDRQRRIASARHPIWSGAGAALVGGRWNSPGRPVIYGSLSYACAMLEALVNAGSDKVPLSHQYVIADVPEDVSVERHPLTDMPPGWNRLDCRVARKFGDRWLAEQRSAILLVPSVIAQLEWNAVVNPAHPEAQKITVSKPKTVHWDRRLVEEGVPSTRH
jgi:RES domain-containing protein